MHDVTAQDPKFLVFLKVNTYFLNLMIVFALYVTGKKVIDDINDVSLGAVFFRPVSIASLKQFG